MQPFIYTYMKLKISIFLLLLCAAVMMVNTASAPLPADQTYFKS